MEGGMEGGISVRVQGSEFRFEPGRRPPKVGAQAVLVEGQAVLDAGVVEHQPQERRRGEASRTLTLTLCGIMDHAAVPILPAPSTQAPRINPNPNPAL